MTYLLLLNATYSLAGDKIFYPQYRDKSGLEWSQRVGYSSNGCINIYGHFDFSFCTSVITFSNSSAELACNELSADGLRSRLPTKNEYNSLIREFDHVEKKFGPQLSDKGKVEIENAIGAIAIDPWYGKPNWFWTSTIFENDISRAEIFSGDYGNTSIYDSNRSYVGAVRCVRSAK